MSNLKAAGLLIGKTIAGARFVWDGATLVDLELKFSDNSSASISFAISRFDAKVSLYRDPSDEEPKTEVLRSQQL